MIGAIDNIIEMKCPGCQHTILEEKAKFCSNCGNKLQTQAAVAQDSAATDNTTENYDNFTKRLSDDTHQKKKRKKRKKRKKKVEDRSTDPSPSDLSLVPTDDNKDTKLTPTTFSSLDDHSTETTISGSSVDPPTNPENKALKPQKPIGTTTIAPDNRLTIHFHAVLSKDFKFIPDEDHLYIRAGKCLGTFEENLAELRVIKDLGDHGFLVGGTLTVPKSEVCSGSIPYKYFVFTNKKQKYEYEHIYKLDSQPPNRWLVVKAQLLSEDGDWYQYDDIIYARPSKNMLKRLKNAFWPENRNKLLQSREIAGKIMLEMIFDLKTRSDEDLRHFHSQLQQFFHVFEEREKAHFGQHSLGYGPDHVKNMLKEIMLNNAVPQLQKDVRKDPLKSAVVMVYVHKEFGITLKNEERCQLCHLLCLPNSNKEDFVQYWTTFSQEICFLKRLPDLLLSLINAVKTEEKPDWFLVLPLFHLLKGWTKPFENTLSGNLTLQSWTGLDGVVGCKNLSSQERKAIQHILWKNSHLLEVDPLLVRSFLYLMSLDEMLECINFVKPELLLLLQLYVDKIPQVINSTHFWAMITYITHNLIEEKFSLFSEDYGRDCMKTVITLLNQICSAVTPTPYGPNLSDIVIACMKLVASISDFVFSSDSQETDENKNLEHMRDLVLTALNITREWISRSFRDSLMNRGYSFYRQVSGSKEIKMWDEIISIQFKDGHCTTAWRKSLLQDFEGKYKKEPPLDQIEHYCVSLKESCSFPYLASVIEKCAVEAVTLMCQNKTEGKLFERMTINMKLITTVIENSWPSQDEETEVILEHLLSWTAAKHIFQRYVSKEGMERDISSDANAKIVAAISLFSDVIRSFLNGHIKIGLLKMILKYESTFLQLIKIDCFIEDKLYRDTEKMKRLLQQRQCEVAAIYREKDLVDTLVHRIHQLQEFMKVDAAAMEKRHQINLEEMHLNEFIEVHLFDQFHELHLAAASAEIIMTVKNTLHLQGDFSVLLYLLQVNEEKEGVRIDQIDNDLIQAKKDLVDITETRKDCLRELGLRGNFVRWVKEALEDINELKVFVDLASISAGENDMDVDRVACFHDAVLGYSPLLYELERDADFDKFNTVVKKLWRALENDCHLPKKLRDSARHLEWLKTVKDSHGSVELSSLSLASSINQKGIYIISAQHGKKLCLDKALELRIPEEHDAGQHTRNYSLEELRELQNKLMLMSGKGDQGQHEVDYFTEVFDNVQRLSEAFIALYTADILTSCISTYMSSPKESLPTHDEVLLCTPTTPYEQVELFLRRCFSCGYRGYKIYSLLYADVLTYDFKVHMVPQAPLARVQEYLHEHYVVSEDQCSAAAAFKDRLCVGIVSSTRSGVGKSLYIKRLYQKLKHSTKKTTAMKCIRLIEPTVDEDAVFQSLLNNTETKALTVFHLDVTASVQHGLHEFLFKLLFLRYLMNSEGKVWKCNEKQLYVVEILERPKTTGRKAEKLSLIDVLPKIFCRPPKEILAIHMRFRCGIPVIIMGETGCGKTRLIKFLSNTTDAISSIKEVLCDKTVQGEGLASGSGLQIVAACNPYRKHTDEMIERLESAGLGYRVRAEKTNEKLAVNFPEERLIIWPKFTMKRSTMAVYQSLSLPKLGKSSLATPSSQR
uniref:Ring finger protein 213 n=1 Tax=Knipowitschia caucasica TaxID=637954 RepID=A0AAV2KJR2_KNICA